MATLELRLTNLATAVGGDVKSLLSTITALQKIKTTTVNVPYDAEFTYVALVLDSDISANSKVIASFGTASNTAENDAEELSDLTLVVTPIDGGLEITLSAPGVFGGPIPINYLIGT
jgi:hypothetical protein